MKFLGATWLLLLCGIAQGQVVALMDVEIKYTYSGQDITFSWSHCDPDVVYEIEVYKYSPTTPTRVAISAGFPATSYIWSAPRLGLYYMRVRAQNVLAIHGDELYSEWRVSHTMEDDPVSAECPSGPVRNFLIYADLAPPTGGGF